MSPDTLSLLERFVGYPTESRTPNRALIDEVAERLAALGARVRLIDGTGAPVNRKGAPGSVVGASTEGVGASTESVGASGESVGASGGGIGSFGDRAGRVNLLASFGPQRPGGLFLSGHSDVVPAGSGWATDPYRLTRVGDRLCGRGTADMKGFIAAAVAAITRHALGEQSTGLPAGSPVGRHTASPSRSSSGSSSRSSSSSSSRSSSGSSSQSWSSSSRSWSSSSRSWSSSSRSWSSSSRSSVASLARRFSEPLHLALSFDEEIGCVGVRGLLAAMAADETVRPELVVIGEPSMMRPSHRHLGKVGYELELRSRAAHSSLSYRIPSAIAAAGRIIAALDEIGESAARLAEREPKVGEPEVTVNCGVIRGGTGMNVVADHCHLTFELRHTAERDPDAALAPLWASVAAQHHRLTVDPDNRTPGKPGEDTRDSNPRPGTAGGLGITAIETIRYPGLATDTADRRVAEFVGIAQAGDCAALGYGTEGGLFAAALGVPVVICGPGDIADAHRPDEYVSFEQLARADALLDRLLHRWCPLA